MEWHGLMSGQKRNFCVEEAAAVKNSLSCVEEAAAVKNSLS